MRKVNSHSSAEAASLAAKDRTRNVPLPWLVYPRQHEQTESIMKSKAVALGHPIHPMLIPFSFAFLTGAVLFDAAGWFRLKSE